MPAHNIASAGDSLTTLSLNHEWREIIASALQFYFHQGYTDLALDNDELLTHVLDDLYTAENIGASVKTREIVHDFVTGKTTTSATFVDVAGASWTHTPTLSKVSIEMNFEADMSTANRGYFRILLDGNIGNSASQPFIENTVSRTVALIDSFDVTPNVQFTLKLQMRSSGGTLSIRPQTAAMIRIIEHD